MAGDSWKRAAFYAVVVLVWAGLHTYFVFVSDTSPLDHRLIDTDSYMRLERVTELVHGEGWYDNVVERSNAPYGDELHWTRPFDVLIVAGAAPAMPFIGVDDPVFWSGALICSFLHLAIVFAMLWAARPLLGPRSPLLAAVLLVQPAILGTVEPGRFDHHALQLLLFAIVLGCGIRLAQRGEARAAVVAGIAGALGIWVSVEMLLPMALLGGSLAAQWVVSGDSTKIRSLRYLSLATAGALTLAIVAERPPSAVFDVEQDRLSIEHVFAAIVAAAVLWLPLAPGPWRRTGDGRRRRVLQSGASVALMAIGVLVVFPRAILGPEADIDPAIRSIWLDKVGEMQPLLQARADIVGPLLLYVGQAVVSAVSVVVVLRRRRGERDFAAWAFVSAALLVYFVLTLQHVRASSFLAISGSIPLVQGLIDLRRWMADWKVPAVRAAAWATACVGCCGGFLVVGGAMTASAMANLEGAELGSCELDGITPYLSDRAGYGGSSLVIAATIDYGPQLIAETPHKVIAGPYHRNAAGIRDLYNLFTAEDADAAKEIVDARGVDLILVCPSAAEATFLDEPKRTDSVYVRLRDGVDLPTWVREIRLPADIDAKFKLFEVER